MGGGIHRQGMKSVCTIVCSKLPDPDKVEEGGDFTDNLNLNLYRRLTPR